MFANLKRARKLKKYSCEDMSKMLQISPSYYSQIENGKRKLDYLMAVKIASIFSLQPDDIFFRHFEKFKIKIKHKRTTIDDIQVKSIW